MAERRSARCGIARAAAAVVLAGLVAACASGPAPEPAPVILNGAGPGVLGQASIAPRPGEARQIVVRPGQSLGGIAHAYHVPPRAIIAANHLTPPYQVQIGQRLLIPGGGPGPAQHALAAPPAVGPIAAGHPPPEIIPLDGPVPTIAMPPATPPSAAPPRPSGAASLTPPSPTAMPGRSPPEPSAAAAARAEAAAPAPATAAGLPHGGRFPWPVRGRVLAGYGVAPGGAHNDGINIAAPRGAPVAAIDGGVVAYAGNEVRGYGNLVLVKHASGWISAYAHCQELLVNKGDKVSPGQTIAKVGATGGVSEPQLHFELRRGKKAVDPREFLAPAPSAGGTTNRTG